MRPGFTSSRLLSGQRPPSGLHYGKERGYEVNRRQQGFTLIELLVVISIISILASLLLPALGKAKEQGVGIYCVNNLRQIGMGMQMYGDDNGDHLPVSSANIGIPGAGAWNSGPIPWTVALFQRGVKRWRATAGPAKEVFFSQVHDPGRLCASDFSHMKSLDVTIGGQPFDHLVYHFVLTYSNWESITFCLSESFESSAKGCKMRCGNWAGCRNDTARIA